MSRAPGFTPTAKRIAPIEMRFAPIEMRFAPIDKRFAPIDKRFAPTEMGFTLIEMMAVVVLVLLVTGVALNGYVDLAGHTRRAADLTRDLRRGTAVLDRVARDLQAARLVVKPEAMDPLEHPWLFFAESRGGNEGADRLKFVTLGQSPQADSVPASDLAQVAWFTRTAEDGTLDLLRWSYPRLPEGLDRRLPRPDDPGVFLVADELESFGVRFLDDAGEWTDRPWPSRASSRAWRRSRS
jgi:type II secretory pathway component PulJ